MTWAKLAGSLHSERETHTDKQTETDTETDTERNKEIREREVDD